MIGFAASLLAVWCQILLLAMISLAPLGVGADPLGDVPICHADQGSQHPQQAPGHHTHDCALCILCLSHALPMALLTSAPALPARQSIVMVRLDSVQPRAPPLRPIDAAQPRGPPALI
jgi:hypothetical protein